MSKLRKIALFADVLEENFDGVSITLHKILKNAPKDSFKFLVITSHPPKDINAIPHQIFITKYFKFPLQKGYRMGLAGKNVIEVLDEFAPDLIHFTSPSLFGKFAINYGRKRSIPVLTIYHTHFPTYIQYYVGKVGDIILGPLVNQFVMRFYKRSDMTLVPTKPIERDLMKLGVPKEKMKIWGRAIETKAFNPSFRDENLFADQIPEGNRKVLFVSRLIREKNMGTIYKTYKQVLKQTDDVTFIITGDGPMRRWLEKRMPKAVFTGKQTGHELAKIYASCDVFFFTSVTETFANVIIEAMASGLPVVSADAGGPSELVRDGKNGYLVKTGQAKEFADLILKILNDEGLKRNMSEKALNSVTDRSLDSLLDQLWKIYEDTITRS